MRQSRCMSRQPRPHGSSLILLLDRRCHFTCIPRCSSSEIWALMRLAIEVGGQADSLISVTDSLGIEFKRRISLECLNATQQAMIKLRLDLLDGFLRPGTHDIESYFAPGGLVLVDLTDPFLDGKWHHVVSSTVRCSYGGTNDARPHCGRALRHRSRSIHSVEDGVRKARWYVQNVVSLCLF
jgi:hypothetical protein